MKYIYLVFLILLTACVQNSSDDIQSIEQERILQEGTSQIGMPAIKNFRERKLLKQVLELRDQDGLITYTYTFAEASGTLTFLCNSIGYGLPAATQFTNPQKTDRTASGHVVIAQADPNGLFSPASAEGTWILCLDPNDTTGKGKTLPVYSEPKLIVSPFKLQ